MCEPTTICMQMHKEHKHIYIYIYICSGDSLEAYIAARVIIKLTL